MRYDEYIEQLRNSALQHEMGGEYREAHAMLTAVKDWAFYNLDSWLEHANNIEDITIGQLQVILQQRIDLVKGYYKVDPHKGEYARNKLVDFVNSKQEAK